jgi:thiaminase/transcriptional activator TenA
MLDLSNRVGAEPGTLCDRLFQNSRSIWERQFDHPFVEALGNGSLPRENFEFYILQDARFLEQLTKIFAAGAIASDEPAVMEKMCQLALDTIRVEREVHETFAREFGLTIAQMEATPLAPTNYGYTSHLLSVVNNGTLPEILTATLPCAWIYAEIGKHFVSLGDPPADHPYRNWIQTYADPSFEEVGTWLRTTLNRITPEDEKTFRRLDEIFTISSRYEWMFWEMAWTLEAWKPEIS